MTNPFLHLKALGQSVWYDNIDRAQLLSGQFQGLIDEDGIVGTTCAGYFLRKSPEVDTIARKVHFHPLLGTAIHGGG